MPVQTKKKTWYNLIAPKLFDNQNIGLTIASEPKNLINKKFSINLMSITGDPKNQNINIKFVIESVRETNTSTYVVGYEITPAGLRRHMRRNTSNINDSFMAKTKDGNPARIKTFILTKEETKRSIRSNIMKEARKLVSEILSKKTFEQFVEEVIKNAIQKQIKDSLKKIYPVKIFEIRIAEIEEKEQAKKPSEEISGLGYVKGIQEDNLNQKNQKKSEEPEEPVKEINKDVISSD